MHSAGELQEADAAGDDAGGGDPLAAEGLAEVAGLAYAFRSSGRAWGFGLRGILHSTHDKPAGPAQGGGIAHQRPGEGTKFFRSVTRAGLLTGAAALLLAAQAAPAQPGRVDRLVGPVSLIDQQAIRINLTKLEQFGCRCAVRIFSGWPDLESGIAQMVEVGFYDPSLAPADTGLVVGFQDPSLAPAPRLYQVQVSANCRSQTAAVVRRSFAVGLEVPRGLQGATEVSMQGVAQQ